MKNKSSLASVGQMNWDLSGLSSRRKHVYFYLLLALITILLGRMESLRSHASAIQAQTAQADELKSLVQNLY